MLIAHNGFERTVRYIQIILICTASLAASQKKRKWVHDINLERNKYGEFCTLMPQLRKDEKRFYIYFRMTSECFDEVLNLITDDIRKSDTNYREAITPEERLAIALRTTSLIFNDILPENPKLYDKMRPPKKDGNPTTVYFHVTVMGLDSIDENSMTYAADIFFAQTWKDYRLRLPENMTSEYRLLEVDWLKNMWRPDSFFKNAKAVTFQTMTIPNHYMWLYKDKTILYMVKLTLTLSCAMNFMIYPHDTQECKLQMESLSHTTDDMIFQWDPEVPLVVDENIELPQLQLVKNYTADCTQVYSTGNFTCLEVIFVLKRRLGYYLFHTYIPTCLIVIMSWVSFWIKPEAAPARVTLGVTSLLTLSTQHAKSQASLPPVSYLKAVDAFMSVCTVFVFLALMEYCLVNIVLGDSDGKKPPAEPPKPDKIFDLAAKENARLLTGQPPQPPRPAPVNRNLTRAINIDRYSRVFFPLTFFLLNISYWIMFAPYL